MESKFGGSEIQSEARGEFDDEGAEKDSYKNQRYNFLLFVEYL